MSIIVIGTIVVRITEITVEETEIAKEIVREIGETVAETIVIAAIGIAKIVTGDREIETLRKETGIGIETGTEIESVPDATETGIEIGTVGGNGKIGIAIATTIIAERVWTLSTTMVVPMARLWKGSTTNRNRPTTP